MNLIDAVKYGFKNYANFQGVVNRRTWWMWYLFTALVSIAFSLLTSVVGAITGATSAYVLDGTMMPATNGASSAIALIGNLASLALALPTLALAVRRLRDVGYNPLILLISLAPALVLFIGVIAGGLAGASMSGGSGFESIGAGFAGALLGMIPGFLLAAAWGIFLIVALAKPTKTAAQGNKYAVA